MGFSKIYHEEGALEKRVAERQFVVAITFDVDKKKHVVENLELTTKRKEIPAVISDITQLKIAREILLELIAKMESGEVEGRNLWAVDWEDDLVQ